MFSLLLAIAISASTFAHGIPSRMCSYDETPNSPHVGTLEWVQSLVHDADLIVRARALRYGEGDHYLVPPDAAGIGGAVRAIEFEVLENLTPTSVVATAPIIYIGGNLTGRDDFNRRVVPYLQVRSSGQRGSCYASDYRHGGEFLLLLRRAPSGYYTPYWALLSPVNEQIRGGDDPWVQWVRRERSSSPHAILDPFNALAEGEELLHSQLTAMSRDHLVDIVKAYRLPVDLTLSDADLVDAIVSAVKQVVG